jgi:hypothetical protein
MRPQKRAVVLFASFLSVALPLLAGEKVPVTWHTEAPDMADVRDFNESGQTSVPVETNCGTAYRIVRIHAFDSFLGSSRGEDRNPMRDRSAGIAITLQVDTGANRSLTGVEIEAGSGDWSDHMQLALPIYSPEQLRSLGSEVTWVVPHEAFYWPKFWNNIHLKCREAR